MEILTAMGRWSLALLLLLHVAAEDDFEDSEEKPYVFPPLKDVEVQKQAQLKSLCSEEADCRMYSMNVIKEFELPAEEVPAGQSLRFPNTIITYFPLKLFTSVPLVKTVTIYSCQLEFIYPESFAQADQLTSLKLVNNRIVELKPRVFSAASNLEVLDLSSNLLKTLHVDVFRGLTKLKQLLMLGNDVTELPLGIFDDLVALEVVDLSLSKISHLADNLFAQQMHLTRVDFTRNTLNSVGANAFKQVGELILDHNWPLKELEINYNVRRLVISDGFVSKLVLNGKVEDLFSDNPLKEIHLTHPAELQKLMIRNSKLSNVDFVKSCPNLKSLSLDWGNDINQLPMPWVAKNLTTLTLKGAGLTEFPYEVIQSLDKLVHLSLVVNKIKSIDPAAFVYLKRLKTLELNQNEWNCNALKAIFAEVILPNGIDYGEKSPSDIACIENTV